MLCYILIWGKSLCVFRFIFALKLTLIHVSKREIIKFSLKTLHKFKMKHRLNFSSFLSKMPTLFPYCIQFCITLRMTYCGFRHAANKMMRHVPEVVYSDDEPPMHYNY